jgi:hypothetical protein
MRLSDKDAAKDDLLKLEGWARKHLTSMIHLGEALHPRVLEALNAALLAWTEHNKSKSMAKLRDRLAPLCRTLEDTAKALVV